MIFTFVMFFIIIFNIINNISSHCVSEHNHPSWSDENFEIESRKLETLLGNHEKKLTREKEEREIVIPRLPKKCTHCSEILRTPATWKYHVLAHKFGQVFCSTCLTCVLGHQFQVNFKIISVFC